MADYYIGLMSGTSLDGADGVLVDFSGDKLKVLASASEPFSESFRAELTCHLGKRCAHTVDFLCVGNYVVFHWENALVTPNYQAQRPALTASVRRSR